MSRTPGPRERTERVRAAAEEQECQEDASENRTQHAANPVASWINGTSQETNDLDKVLALAQSDGAISRNAVCIIEDISWDWIRVMEIAWGIEEHFFADYGVNPGAQGDTPWETLFRHKIWASRGLNCYHVDGAFEHQHLAGHSAAFVMLNNALQRSAHCRRCWVSAGSSHPPSSSTRISYCRVNANLYLFLVDPPPFPTALDKLDLKETDIKASMQHLRPETRLRLQCPGSRSIVLPQLLKRRVYNLRQIFSRALSHSWPFFLMFESDSEAIYPGELLHIISAFLHRSNFSAIDREIKAISFEELPNPDMRTNSKLLTLREVLSELATGTAETQKNASSDIIRFIDDEILRCMDSCDQLDYYSPIERLAAINQQASDLQRFLMDSFQLLMSSVSVAESQNAAKQAKLSMEQAVRTAKLTQLAFVYIPLTFVTSIFGMNVRELVDPVLPVWVCFVTLVVVAAATAAIFGSYKYKPEEVLRNLLSERYARALGLRGTAVPSQSTDTIATDVEKGPTCS